MTKHTTEAGMLAEQGRAMPSARATGLRPQPATRSSRSSVPIAGEYPNYYGMYLREREHCRTVEELLSRAVTLLDMETDRREASGEDVAHIRAFITEARSV
jgi:hypothetical protein